MPLKELPRHDVIAVAPAAATDIMVQPEQTSDDLAGNPAEKVYSHVLDDGREVAGTLDQARRVCTFIGAMTIEESQATLEDADLARRVMERGRAKRQTEANRPTSPLKKPAEFKDSPPAKPSRPRPVAAEKVSQQPIKEAEVAFIADQPVTRQLVDFSADSDAQISQKELLNVAEGVTTAQMDSWLTQLQQEYEARQHHFKQESAPTVAGEETMAASESPAEAASEQVSAAFQAADQAPNSAATAEVAAPNVDEEAEAAAAHPLILESDEIIGYPAVADEQVAEINEAMGIEDDLVETDQDKDDTEFLSLRELLPDAEKVLQTNQPEPLIEQISEYVQNNDSIEKTVSEEAITLIVEITTIAQELVELRNPVAPAATEEIEAAEQLLLEVCAELLDTLGVEYDGQLLQRFFRAVVEQELLNAEATAADQPLEEGTHERKLFTLHDWTSAAQAKLPSFRLLGRYALWPENGVLSD